ncbi:MAG: PKD domain-containing protein [Gemmatimonadaceae bacterium]|nr:PKD domain-containing protein [Gemmatimonadaceae bacterium]
MTTLARSLRCLGSAVLLLAAACGGGADPKPSVTSPPTPPPTPVATTLVMQSGDGQQGDIGTALAARPTVQVRDASGTVMAGVAVAFTVDSGGGSLAATSAVTGADGNASSGVWTLGTSVGTNVVSASVTGLPSVRFRAAALLPITRTLVDTQTIASSGGVIRYAKAGDPLSGLTITIPARSFPTATQWTVRADSSIAVTLPTDFVQVGPVLSISNGQDYADSVMTVTTPMRVASTLAIAPFYFDPQTGTLEAIPLAARTDSSATFATRHFSNDMMALPRNAPSAGSLRVTRSMSFGTVNVVWVGIPRARLVGSFSSTFRPGADDWEFVNYGDYVNADGICEGMSITAMYYHYFVRAGSGAPLFRRYDQSLANQWDNVQGIRFAGSVQGDYVQRFYAGIDQVQSLIDEGLARGAAVEDLTSMWILLTLKLNQRPVLLGLQSSSDGHAVVAYAATHAGTRTEVSFADPNFPGQVRKMVFEAGVLTPVTLQVNAAAAAASYNRAYPLGVSGEIPIDQISRRWTEFRQQRAGADRYPATYRHEVYNALTDRWTELGDTVRTTSARVEMRFICPGCPLKTPSPIADEQVNEVWNEAGSAWVTDKSLDVSAGTTKFLAVAKGYANFDPQAAGTPGFIDAKPFTVIARVFSVVAEQQTAPVGVDLDFTARPNGIGGANPRFRWDFGDGTAPLLLTNDSTATHRWNRNGTFIITVEMRDATGTLVARLRFSVVISDKASFVWGFIEAAVQRSTLPTDGIGTLRSDTLIFMRMSQWMARLTATPEDHGLLIFGRPNGGAKCKAVAILDHWGAARDADTIRSIESIGGIVGSCGDEDYTGSLDLPSRTNGPLTGLASPVVSPETLLLPGGSINAMNSVDGANTAFLRGTFVLNVRYSTGIGTYTVVFEAIRSKPDD